MVATLVLGAVLFIFLEPEKKHGFFQAMFFTWSLVFGEPPEDFPAHPALRLLFFLVPVVGLVIIIEGIVDFALLVRDRQRSERSWCMTMAAGFRDHIVLVGMGRLGYATFRMLRTLGETVVVIERDPQNQFLEDVRRDGAAFFVCDARRESVLADANVAGARSIICATTDDLANLEIALDARRMNPKISVVMRMFDQNMANKVRDGFNIKVAMSQAAISAPTFAMAAMEPAIVSTMVVGERLVVAQRWAVRADGPFCGKSVGQLLNELQLTVLERRPRGGHSALFPPAQMRVEAGDELVVQGTFEALRDLGRHSRT